MPTTTDQLCRELRFHRVALVGFAALALVAWTRPAPEILRVRGLVVEDSTGTARVIIGAPLPGAIINGKPSQRIGNAAGITIHDPKGNERGGFATFDDGNSNLCLDYARGVKEAACLVVSGGDDYAGLVVNATPNHTGYDRLTALVDKKGKALVKIAAPSGRESAILRSMGDSAAQLLLYDPETKTFRDALKTGTLSPR